MCELDSGNRDRSIGEMRDTGVGPGMPPYLSVPRANFVSRPIPAMTARRLTTEDSMLWCSPATSGSAVRIATGECEPFPHQAQDLNLTVVRAYKRSR
jgi:hypothetical protein